MISKWRLPQPLCGYGDLQCMRWNVAVFRWLIYKVLEAISVVILSLVNPIRLRMASHSLMLTEWFALDGIRQGANVTMEEVLSGKCHNNDGIIVANVKYLHCLHRLWMSDKDFILSWMTDTQKRSTIPCHEPCSTHKNQAIYISTIILLSRIQCSSRRLEKNN